MQNEITELRNQVRTLKRITCFVFFVFSCCLFNSCQTFDMDSYIQEKNNSRPLMTGRFANEQTDRKQFWIEHNKTLEEMTEKQRLSLMMNPTYRRDLWIVYMFQITFSKDIKTIKDVMEYKDLVYELPPPDATLRLTFMTKIFTGANNIDWEQKIRGEIERQDYREVLEE